MRRFLLLLMAAAPAAFPAASLGLDLRVDTDALAAPLIRDRLVASFVVGYYRRGETQVIGFGEIRRGSGIAPDGATVYEIGSITKVFTGILLADRTLEGGMEIDAPVQRYLPASVKVPVIESQPITLRHLATHTSGLARDPDAMRPIDRQNPYADLTIEQLYTSLSGFGPRQVPGKFGYSNFGMGILGHVMTLQAKASFEALVIQRICEPLGMHDTRPNPHAGMLPRLAPPYDDAQILVKSYDLPTLGGAGGIRSTVNDMLRFITANLGPDETTAIGRAMKLSQQKLHTLEDGTGYAYGWKVSRSGQILSHTGTTGGYRAFFAIVPSRQTGIVVLSNTGRRPYIPQLGERLLAVALGQRPKPMPAPRDAVLDNE
jgi:serine-type D-Ala-D-Ala carboxypeptidase/endopeptidase